MAELIIETEAQAYQALEKAIAGTLPPDTTLKFGDWPNLHFVIKGDGFDASITPALMTGLLAYQKGIYRSFASIKYGNPNKRLTDTEKQLMQINVKVSKGSSQFDVPSDDLLKHLVSEVLTKMPAEYVLIAVLTFIVMYFGSSFLRTLLDNRKEVRIKEVSDETQRATLEAMKFSSEQETKRTAILLEATKRVPTLTYVTEEAVAAHSELVKSVRSSDEAEIAGVSIDGEEAVVLTRNARNDSAQTRLDGKYRLVKLDWSEPSSFRVRVQRLDDDLIVDADVQDDTLTGAYKEILRSAEWNRKPVFLSINAKKVGNAYRDAVIVRVESGMRRRSRFR